MTGRGSLRQGLASGTLLCLGLFVLTGAQATTAATPLARISTPLSVGITTCTFTDPTRNVLAYDTNPPTVLSLRRTLVTEVRYPTVFPTRGKVESAGAHPAERRGPFPLIVFAHGYNVTPDTYAPLLDSWVRAGFVVAAPIFPDENQAEVAAQHGANTEGDLVNEPADLSFVTVRLLAATRGHLAGCPLLHGLLEPSEIGLAGHSDGAEAVGLLGYGLGRDPQGVSFQTLRAAGGYRSVAVLSGQEAGGPYGTAAPDPALLVVQSATDQCNLAGGAVQLYRDIDQPEKWFLELLHAHHLPPFDGVDAPAFAVSSRVTTRFFAFTLEGDGTPAGLLASGNATPGEAEMFAGAPGPTIPYLPPSPTGCSPN